MVGLRTGSKKSVRNPTRRVRPRPLLFPCFLVLCLGLFGFSVLVCAQTGMEREEAPAHEEPGLRLVIVPVKNAFILREQFKPVADFLAQKLGRIVYLEVMPDYISAVRALVDKEADGAFLGSYTYLQARQLAAVEPLVRPVWPEDKNICRSYIIARKNSDIREFSDMEDKRLAVADINSFSGYIFAACMFENNGIGDTSHYFDKIILAGSHDTVIWSVVTGEADVGVAQSRVYDALLREYPELEDKLYIVSRSAELPAISLVLRQDFPVAEKDRLYFLLSQMDKTDDGKLALAALGAVAFAGASDADYDPLRRLLEGARCGGGTSGDSWSGER